VTEAPSTKPLAGRRILITRAPHQASELAERLAALGATPILIPTIEIAPPSSFAALDAALCQIAEFDVAAFTSPNAVNAFHRRAETLGLNPQPRRIAVVGPATARAIEAIGLRADVMPQIFTAESLAERLAPEAAGSRFLLVLAEDAPPKLQAGLEAAGGHVTVAAAYSNRIPAESLTAVQSLFADSQQVPDAALFTSASTAENLIALLQSAGLTLPEQVARGSIGPITSKALRGLGQPAHFEAAESTIPALAEAVAAYFRAPE